MLCFHITWQPRTSTHKHLLYWETLPVDQLRNQTKHGSHKAGYQARNSKETNRWGGGVFSSINSNGKPPASSRVNLEQTHKVRTEVAVDCTMRSLQSPQGELKHQTSHPRTTSQEKRGSISLCLPVPEKINGNSNREGTFRKRTSS